MAEDWRSNAFRQNVLAKLEEVVQQFQPPMSRTVTDLEATIFSKSSTREDYLNQMQKLFSVIKSNGKKPGPMVAGVNNSSTIQKTLAQNQQNIGQSMGVGQNVATNLLQTLNQRPGQQMQPGMHNKMPGMNVLQNQQMNMNQMSQMQNIPNNPMMSQMNQMNQGNMNQQMNFQPVQQHLSNPQMGPNQMQQNMQNHLQNQMQNQLQNQMQSQMQNQLQNQQMSGHQMGGLINSSMQSTMQPQQSPSQQQQQQQQHMNQISSAQMNVNQMSQQQLGHMQRKQPVEVMNTGYTGQRNMTPNQFLSQSPSSSAPSPGGLVAPTGNQMVPSPALVSSPLNPQHTHGGPRSMTMAPSPSSSLNTPAGMIGGAVPSPVQDDQVSQACKEKIHELRKFIEPLKQMILKSTKDGFTDKMLKMKRLLEILSNPNHVTNLETLNKCEVALKRMDWKNFVPATAPTLPSNNTKEYQFFTPLLEVVSNLLNQNSIPNHTLNRTFGPCVEALFGPEIKNLPPPLKKRKIEEIPREIPDVLQGEIARLDQRFKISLDPTQQNGAKNILLICWLDDKHLPCVPPVSITVPADYPSVPPKCVLASHEYATPYLNAVHKALDARLDKFPSRFSISQVLDAWEASVRQACSPKVQQEEKVVAAIKTSAIQTPTISSSNHITNGIPANLIGTAAS